MAVTATVTPVDLASRLMTARTVDDVDAILDAIPHKRWEPLGGKRGNLAAVNAISDSADAVVERVTNGIDSLIEREVLKTGKSAFISPRDAVRTLFQFPMDDEASLDDQEVDRSRRKLAEQLVVTLRDSGVDKQPTVNVLDYGVGQHPADFPKTLVSLNEENKRTSLYLMGAYGWGGAASFSFCRYAIFVSRRDCVLRRKDQADEVGWTIVRYNPLADDMYSKHGLYEYLCLEGSDGAEVPSFPPSALPTQFQDWTGTSCTLIQYELSRYSDAAWRPNHSLWLMFNALLFDPVLPFLIRDERKRAASNQKSALGGLVINGTAARLARDARKRDETRRIDYKNSYEGNLGTAGNATIRYYVLREKGDSKKDWEPTEVYVTADQSVTITHNGQRQGSWRRELFNQLGLLTLSKFMIVQVDCDGLDWRAKRELFTTTRDRLKDNPLAKQLRDMVATALRSDPSLARLDENRKQAALSRRAAQHAERIRKMLQKAIDSLRQGDEALYRKLVSNNPELPVYGDQPLVAVERLSDEEKPDVEPLNVCYDDEPTEIRVINRVVTIPAGGKGVVKIWMDAIDGYIAPGGGRGRFGGLVTKGSEEFRLVGYSELRGGFMRCTVSADKGVPGDRGRIVFTVTKSDGLPLVDEAELEVVEAPTARVRRTDKTRKITEEGPNVVDVHRDQWETFDFDEERVARVESNSGAAGVTTIYVNWDYPQLDAKLMAERKADDEVIANYKSKFCAAMAYAAWLQDSQKEAESLSEDMRNSELRRAAQVFLFSEFVKER